MATLSGFSTLHCGAWPRLDFAVVELFSHCSHTPPMWNGYGRCKTPVPHSSGIQLRSTIFISNILFISTWCRNYPSIDPCPEGSHDGEEITFGTQYFRGLSALFGDEIA